MSEFHLALDGGTRVVTVIRIKSTDWFAKASGVLLVAGVGSYCAYRICTKYLGQKFVWMLMDSTRYDQLPGADFRFIHPSQIVCESDDEEVQDEEEEGDRNSESEFLSRVSESRPASEMSLSRLQKVRRSVRTHGLLGLHQPRTPRSGVLRREGGSVTGSTHSRQRRDFSPSAASDCSASLQIVWEDNGQQWDDEFAQNGAHLHSSSSRLRLPQFSHHEIPPNDHLESHGSYGDLCSVFDDVLSMTTREDQIEIHLGWAEGEDGYRENERDDEKIRMKIDSESINEASNPVLKKCMTDSKYMYQSVTVGSDFDGSECGSVLSGRSRMSRISQTRGLQRKAKKTAAHGLWNLSASKTSINQETSHSSNDPMTDSGLSSGLRSDEGISNDLSKSTKLFDSALGAELFSSDDEQVNSRLNDGIMKRNRIAVSGMKVKSRVNLDGSSNLSVASLEWFDDDGMRENSMQEENLLPGTSRPTPTRVIITGQEWDFDSQSSGSATSNTRSTENEWRLRRVQTSRRPTKTRDTMVFACERLQPHSKAFRKIQSLYTREGFRRVGDGCKGSENFLASFLSSAIYHDLPSMATLTHEELDRRYRMPSAHGVMIDSEHFFLVFGH
ncbi:unnamed protein product, partial [Mesorhabditis belari]|uniref:Uncharacterized protein n=1 Tax=Mesorhabditis belari TaxID=2138241 RepID=A0AAF3FCV4_9BILA